MSDDRGDERPWIESEGACNHVAELLDKSGVTHEARVAKTAQRLASVLGSKSSVYTRAEQVIWGELDGETPLRQLDQQVTFYDELEMQDAYGIQLLLSIPIEAKHRRGSQIFGVEVGGSPTTINTPLIGGPLASSSLIRNAVTKRMPDFLTGETLNQLAILRFDGETPKEWVKEELIYKATASLYDFIQLSASESAFDEAGRDRLSREGLLSEFQSYISETHYAPQYVANRWIKRVTPERGRAYLTDQVAATPNTFFMVELYYPVVCLDSRLYSVELDESGYPDAYHEKDLLVTSSRVRRWPSRLAANVAGYGPEAVVTVTNLNGLARVLEGLFKFFTSVREKLVNADHDEVSKAHIESDFLACVADPYGGVLGKYTGRTLVKPSRA